LHLLKIKLIGLMVTALTLSACSATPLPSPPAKTWVEGTCSAATPGVTLSVDYLGNVKTHCALNFVGDGWSLFSAAGFEVKGTDKYPTAFACQIDQKPRAADCSDAGSTSYWGYYLATNGIWTYATTGAADHKSTCGTHEGWAYMQSEKTQIHLPKPVEFTCD
jgi:hypothetical protein